MGGPGSGPHSGGGGGSEKSGGGKSGGSAKSQVLKFAPGKVHYDSPKFQAAAKRQAKAGNKAAHVIKHKK